MDNAGDGTKNDSQGGFSKIAPLFEKTGGTADARGEQKSKSLEHAPTLPSSEDVARMTMPVEKKEDRMTRAGIISGRQSAPLPRDPLFAAHVLEGESRGGFVPIKQESKKPLPTFIVVEAPREEESETKRIRTFSSDLAETLKTQKTSIVQMILAEHEKKRTIAESVSPKNPRNVVTIVLSAILGIGGILTIGFSVWRYNANEEKTAPILALEMAPSLVFAEIKKGVDITDFTKEQVVRAAAAEVAATSARLDFIAQIYFTRIILGRAAPNEIPVPVAVTAPDFFRMVSPDMPVSLIRALSPDFFFGVHVFNGNQPFMILRTDYFESAFAGMLKWENAMAREVLPLFGIQITREASTRSFEDLVIRNRDIRALRNEQGDIVLLYLFRDKNTIIIATADETAREVVDRLNRTGN
ncbi:MAG: hypothetical protein AAB819_00330 [Patescibacteria group bacterium]